VRVPLIALDRVCRSFAAEGSGKVEALRDVSLRIREGEFVCVTGPSGSGKSTLLNLLGCLDSPSSGSYRLDGREIQNSGPNALALLRRRVFGFVFQSHNLLDTATALENVALPGRYAGLSKSAANKRAERLLNRLGLADRSGHLPAELSGGERQRVALARALMNGGRIVLADEPTGALDSKSAEHVLAVLKELARDGHTVVLVTHNPEIAELASRRIELLDGRVASDSGAIKTPSRKSQPGSLESRPGVMAETFNAIAMGLARIGASLIRGERWGTTMAALGVCVAVWLGGMTVLLGEAVYLRVVHAVNIMGLERIHVMARPGGGFEGLTVEDAVAIEKEVPNVRAVSPAKFLHGVDIRRGDFSANFSIEGTVDRGTKESRGHIGYRLAAGEFITSQEDDGQARVAVLGSVAREQLFPPDMNPVGQEISIRGWSFRVKGVYEHRTGMVFQRPNQSAEEFRAVERIFNAWIYIPFSTFQALFTKHNYLYGISVFLENPDQLFEAEKAIRDLGFRRHGTDAYFLEHSGEHLLEARRQRERMRRGLGALAGVALLAGSLGVMALVLMNVRLRRREIGLRMAVGARRRDILWQFLAEAMALVVAAGTLGLLAALASLLAMEWFGYPVDDIPPLIWAPFSGALLMGLVFGIVPARRAARSDPVAALACE